MLFLDSAELDQLYPCRLVLSEHGVVDEAGPSLARLLGRSIVGVHFDEVFRVTSGRRGSGETFARGQFHTPVVLATREAEPILLRGAVLTSALGRRHLLLGGVPDGKLAVSQRFRFGDFSPTDGAIDLLLALQLRDASVEDTHRLTERLMEARISEAASEAKTQFFAKMSHELRTPLNAIIGFTEIVAEDLAETGAAQASEDLGRVLRAANHLLGLVNDVLDLAKIEAGKMLLAPQPVDFAEIARDVAATLEPLARKGGNVLHVEIAEGVAPGVSDPMRLKQCLLNLLGNALKFTTDGDVRLGVVAAPARDMIVYTISDTGIGMTEDELQRLFKPFVQATTGTTAAYGGTGLGLAITRESAGLLGGEVNVTSRPGVGSVFRLVIPRVCGAGRAQPSCLEAAA